MNAMVESQSKKLYFSRLLWWAHGRKRQYMDAFTYL